MSLLNKEDNLSKSLLYLENNYEKSLDNEEVFPHLEVIEANKDKIDLETLYRPTHIEYNTVGSYLWGCSQNYYGPVSKSCSILCNPKSLNYDEKSNCQYQLWTCYQDKLISIGHSFNNMGYIYVDEKWSGMLEEDIEKLKNAKLNTITILKTSNNVHETLHNMISLNEIPKKIITPIPRQKQEKTRSPYALIFFLVILGLLFALWYQKGSPTGNEV